MNCLTATHVCHLCYAEGSIGQRHPVVFEQLGQGDALVLRAEDATEQVWKGPRQKERETEEVRQRRKRKKERKAKNTWIGLHATPQCELKNRNADITGKKTLHCFVMVRTTGTSEMQYMECHAYSGADACARRRCRRARHAAGTLRRETPVWHTNGRDQRADNSSAAEWSASVWTKVGAAAVNQKPGIALTNQHVGHNSCRDVALEVRPDLALLDHVEKVVSLMRHDEGEGWAGCEEGEHKETDARKSRPKKGKT